MTATREELRARVHGVTAAVSWTEELHPRGVGGKFISKDSTVSVSNGKTGTGTRKYRAQVVGMTKKGVRVQYVDQQGHPVKTPKGMSTFIAGNKVSHQVEHMSDPGLLVHRTAQSNTGTRVARPGKDQGLGRRTSQVDTKVQNPEDFNKHQEELVKLAQARTALAKEKALQAKKARQQKAVKRKQARKAKAALRKAKSAAKKKSGKAAKVQNTPADWWSNVRYNPSTYSGTTYDPTKY